MIASDGPSNAGSWMSPTKNRTLPSPCRLARKFAFRPAQATGQFRGPDPPIRPARRRRGPYLPFPSPNREHACLGGRRPPRGSSASQEPGPCLGGSAARVRRSRCPADNRFRRPHSPLTNWRRGASLLAYDRRSDSGLCPGDDGAWGSNGLAPGCRAFDSQGPSTWDSRTMAEGEVCEFST